MSSTPQVSPPGNGATATVLTPDQSVSTSLPEPRKPSCEPKAAYDGVTTVAKAIRVNRDRPLFALVADRISDDTMKEVFSWRKELRDVGASPIDVIVHSPGGNLTSCYMIARLLSRFVKRWEALIPELAASGATLICLGSSNIVMSEIAQLGPLDPQVASKKREKFFVTERQSPLEAFEALRYLREFAVASLDALMEVLTDRGIAPQKALETAVTMASDLVKPVLEKIDPYDLGAFSLDNKTAINYCQQVARPSDVSRITQRKAYYKSLVEGYPVHEFAIDLLEARSLKLAVSEAPDDLENLFDGFRSLVPKLEYYVGLVPE